MSGTVKSMYNYSAYLKFALEFILEQHMTDYSGGQLVYRFTSIIFPKKNSYQW